MKINSFNELFLLLLSDIYFVENKLIMEIPKIISKTYSEELREALKNHLNETKIQVRRLEKVFKLLNQKPMPVEWAMSLATLSMKTEKFLEENIPSSLTDACIITMVQRIEHFEIATYGTLIEFADLVEHEEIRSILKESLKEEGKADTILTKLAQGGLFSKGINVEAQHHL